MIYEFEEFQLDTGKIELRQDGETVAIEPQVFALLLLLVENRDRMVSKDEIIEKVWDGRFVSESAVASRVKSARKALGDDGKTQKYIRTVHGQGFRFVAEASEKIAQRAEPRPLAPADMLPPKELLAPAKPSIAILPFRLVGVAGPYAAIADALPDELISALARLRWLFVIARASSFRFRSSNPDIADVGRALNVRYCLSGVVEVTGDRIAVNVELADTRNGGAVWGERYSTKVDEIYDIRAQIVSNIVSSLEIQIPLNEAQRARIIGPENLDAWSAYHVGLQHLYRFNSKDNAAAQAMFERAVSLEPDFARAHAGLSSTRFQNAFLKYTPDTDVERRLARAHAERSVELDPLDPFANFAMGRTHWIESNVQGGLGWLDRSISLSPNYAQGVYARAWSETVLGRGEEGAEHVSLALNLSPLDPFRYAMLGVKAFSYLLRGNDEEAARWADDAASSPGAHVLIAVIAAIAHGLNGDVANAKRWADNAKLRNPNVTSKDFFEAFPFEHEPTRARITKALADYGF